jgi:hypothetical protein
MSRKILYVGMDESNHGDIKKKIGEIVVATFSYSKKYWDETAKHPNRRDYSQVQIALNEGVDYVYTFLPHELAKHNYSNLPLVASDLVGKVLHFQYAPEIKIGLDGQLSYKDRKNMTKEFYEMGFEPKISNYIKKNGSHVGPKLIYISHLLANNIFRKSMLGIANDSHYLPFDVLELIKK